LLPAEDDPHIEQEETKETKRSMGRVSADPWQHDPLSFVSFVAFCSKG
jgi:hypothetical protein